MQARGVIEPNKLLASNATALVWVHGYLPPGVRRGDRFDVYVEVPSDTETTSLASGWLMETRLSEMAVVGNRVRDASEGIAVIISFDFCFFSAETMASEKNGEPAAQWFSLHIHPHAQRDSPSTGTCQ